MQRPARRGVPIPRPAPEGRADAAPAAVARPIPRPPAAAEAPAAPPPEAPSAVLDSRVARSSPSGRPDDDDAVSRSAKRVAWITVAVVLTLGALVFARYQARLSPPPRPAEAVDRTASASPRPAAAPLAPFDVLSEPSDLTLPIEAPLALGPPFDVVDSITFRANDLTIRLGRVVGTRRGDVCIDAEGLKFACGLMGRAALANYLKTNRLVCHRLMSEKPDRAVKADCWLGDEDVSLHQIEAGFARPDPLAGADLVTAARAAEAAGVGAWRGGWTLVPLTEEQRDGR